MNGRHESSIDRWLVLNVIPASGINRKSHRVWIKLDDGFATHPKVLLAGLEALAVQVRAFCYASKNQTDGFIPVQAVLLFTTDLPAIPEGWATRMVSCGLWELAEGGYHIHDYLEWNCSKKDYDKWKKKLSQAGRKGMKSRWYKENLDISLVISKVISDPVTSSSTSTSISSEGKECEKGEPNWFTQLRRNPLYAHVNFTAELQRIDEWHSRPANKHRIINQRFVANWLNRIEPPLSNGHGTSLICAHHPSLTFADKKAKDTHDYIHHPKYVG